MRYLVVFSVSVFAICRIGTAQDAHVSLPEPLLQAEYAASAIRTARIDWSARHAILEGDAGRRIHFHTWRCADDSWTQEYWGDEEGVFSRDETGQPAISRYQVPRLALVKSGATWERLQNEPRGRVWTQRRDRGMSNAFDFRRLGLNPAYWYDDFAQTVADEGGIVTFDVEVDGGQMLVRARTDGQLDRLWWIDPNRGWNPTRTQVMSSDGEIQAETEFDLKMFDGHWFPSAMRQYRGSAASGEFYAEFKVLSAEFNRPDHPQELTPSSIGFEPGMMLLFQHQDSPVPVPVWDGEAIVSMNDFTQRVRADEVAFGPTIQRAAARANARSGEGQFQATLEQSNTWKRLNSEWERYTRDFINRYRLNNDQAQQAWKLCQECQKAAREFIERRREAFEKLEREPSEKLRAELLVPIDEIFITRLKPRLERIPTTSQRDAATEAGADPIADPPLMATTQPTNR